MGHHDSSRKVLQGLQAFNVFKFDDALTAGPQL